MCSESSHLSAGSVSQDPMDSPLIRMSSRSRSHGSALASPTSDSNAAVDRYRSLRRPILNATVPPSMKCSGMGGLGSLRNKLTFRRSKAIFASIRRNGTPRFRGSQIPNDTRSKRIARRARRDPTDSGPLLECKAHRGRWVVPRRNCFSLPLLSLSSRRTEGMLRHSVVAASCAGWMRADRDSRTGPSEPPDVSAPFSDRRWCLRFVNGRPPNQSGAKPAELTAGPRAT
jgi:hypothetical protein